MKLKYRTIITIFFAGTVLSCGGNSGNTMKFSMIIGQTSDWYRGTERFKQLVE